jgi:hypothetical protein
MRTGMPPTGLPLFGMLLCTCVLLVACAGNRAYSPSDPRASNFTQRAETRRDGPLKVSTAVPDATETLALTGLDLYAQGIQPVWLLVENTGIEVAYMNRKGYSDEGQAAMERWFWQSQLERIVQPGESMQGYIYSHLAPGTKGFTVEAVGSGAQWDVTFFISMPGFTPDYMEARLGDIYRPDQMRELPAAKVVEELGRALPCCSGSAAGDATGLPFNLVLLESPPALRRALMRAGWLETSRDDPSTATARQQYYLGRPPDAVFSRSRPDGAERKELRLWLAPYSSEGRRVVLAQAVHDLAIGDDFTLDPDMNAARIYALQSFWYGQSLQSVGGFQQNPSSSIASPAIGFDGTEYFADGVREYLWLSDEPVALDETRTISVAGWPENQQ